MPDIIQPIQKDLVLLGGGHSHAIVLRKFGMKRLAGVRLTLITNLVDTPYSGMLPCHISGLYSFDDSHIDLRPLANFANCRLFMDKAIGLDLHHQTVLCAHHPPIPYDVLSIDIGSTPATSSVPGAAAYTIPAKPVPRLLQAWDQLLQHIRQHPTQPISLSVVGGGVGGVELILNMQARLQQLLTDLDQPRDHLAIHLFHRGEDIATGRNRWTRNRLRQIMRQRDIQLHAPETVTEVTLTANDQRLIRCESGLTVASDRVFWVTQASAPSWIQATGLATDVAGFIEVEDTLQSCSHLNIFAAGDIAAMIHHPRPKAGVFAVRQGPPLFYNLFHYLQDLPLKPYKPQQQSLNIIDTGLDTSLASRGPFGFESKLARRWKHWIDSNFMALFSEFPDMTQANARQRLWQSIQQIWHPEQPPTLMKCAGCGSKVGSMTLTQVLQRIQPQGHPRSDRVMIGLETPDDAAVVKSPEGHYSVQTVDYFKAIVDDPFLVGQITVHHCLNDLLAMGATPEGALAIVSIPYAAESKVEDMLYQLLMGATQALSLTQTPLVGGHTTEGSELALGFSCYGSVAPNQIWQKSGLQPGHDLIMTKALGTGTLFAADQQLAAKGRWIAHALESMLKSNAAAVPSFQQHQVQACTDISGFGCLGHLMEMIQASQVTVNLDLDAITVLEGAHTATAQGIYSSLHPQNVHTFKQFQAFDQTLDSVMTHPNWPLLFDPQTSGGLLAALPSDQSESCLAALRALGYTDVCRIGQVVEASTQPQITFHQK